MEEKTEEDPILHSDSNKNYRNDDVFNKKEEAKEKEDTETVSKKLHNVKMTDEEHANNTIDKLNKDKPNPASRHEKPVSERSPSSTIQNLDIRSNFYEEDPEQGSDDEDDDTEMTIVDVNDLGEDEFGEDVIINM